MTLKPLLIATASLTITLGMAQSQGLALTLYNGTSGTSPASQGQLIFGALSSSGIPLSSPIPPLTPGFETATTDGVTLTTNANAAEYAGYSNYNPLTSSFVNPLFPTLNQNGGYSIFFNVSLNTTTANSPNRAAFTVTAIGIGNQGIEIGFESNQIFAQNSNFIRGEVASFNTSGNVNYELRVLGNQYQLLANNLQILNGSLRTYTFNPLTSNPPLGRFNPYQIPNFLFFGDNTGQEFGTFTFQAASITLNSTAVPESFSSLALLGLGILGIMIKFKPKG